MEVHILNGDALIDRMQAAGFDNLIVCRECLIDGPVKAATLEQFWHQRADFLSETDEDEQYYHQHVKTEFEKLQQIPSTAVIHVWFGDDLFCQANMWFTIDFLQRFQPNLPVYRVFPTIKNEQYRWHEFGGLTVNDFKTCYDTRVQFTPADIDLACTLWKAYSGQDLVVLKAVSQTPSHCFRFLEEVVQAHIDRFPAAGALGRPEQTLKEIMQSGITDFSKLFPAFSNREGIYGFGDDQVKNMLAKIG